MTVRCVLVFLVGCTSLVEAARAQEAADWWTYRGNPQRTGNVDGKPGPAQPRVVWALKSKDHFVASPVPVKDRLFVSGLGAFNTTNFHCLDLKGPKAQVLWTRSTPVLKLPTVSSPAVLGESLLFGDGMHQTDGAILHCLETGQGLPVWQHAVPGTLVHLEGAPATRDGKVWIGGGAAGVLCVDAGGATLEGKRLPLPETVQVLRKRWQALQAEYEVKKKKDPDFAVPPEPDRLPRAQVARLWQQGKDAWHVDAPVNVVGGRVLAASAFLDKEKLGERSLVCLDAAKGEVKWKTPLPLNPWGGASVQGKVVVVTGSSIGYYPKYLKGAKGFVAAYDLDSGKPLWSKTVTGGAVACAALASDRAIVTATDGKVRAFELGKGERAWIYDAKFPLFAPAAVAGSMVVAADLRGVVHAVDLKTGRGLWTLDLGKDPQVEAPGMVYGGPIVHGGRVIVATCNLEGPFARQPTAVVCIGDK